MAVVVVWRANIGQRHSSGLFVHVKNPDSPIFQANGCKNHLNHDGFGEVTDIACMNGTGTGGRGYYIKSWCSYGVDRYRGREAIS